jgi:AraC-like DNA-binding protein
MGHPKRIGWHPNATGTLTRLAYAHAKARGIDPKSLLKKASLTLDQIKNPDLRLRVSNQINFLTLVADALGDELLGFHLAQPVDLRELGFLYYISASSETLGDALQRLARYGSIANEGVLLRYVDGKNIGIELHYVGVSRHLDRHQIEFFATALVRLCRYLTGTRLLPAHVRFTHRGDSKRRELVEFFGGEIVFAATVDDVSFAPSTKRMSIASADRYLNKFLTKYCEEALSRRSVRRSSLRSTIENAIVPLLPHGLVSLEEIARCLGLSQRTLARRLSSQKLTFSDILQGLRMDLAKRYLADGTLSISQIAWLLGYQEVSSFTHAFKSWTNKTPQQFRSGHK